ncbi:SDR family NAD(P)-dependent oxidoreductase [Photobacterium leiognathi]|uniref:SDR family NAD(P)-dependent oxidoreductase n=1 Tax=Photobacterium leiognathi TaxID=553611 RepID=UPI0027399755|nr:SDR family oxidoreductase [Photobacterium leiognathi]
MNIIITGGSKRLGAFLANQFSNNDNSVFILTKSGNHEELNITSNIQVVYCDLRDRKNVEQVIQQMASDRIEIDVLINNVGTYHFGESLDMSPDIFEDLIQTNLLGLFTMTKACVDTFSSLKHIINIGYAGANSNIANNYNLGYLIAKQGANQLTKGLAPSLGRKGVQINTVSPGHIFNSVDLPSDICAEIPLGRTASYNDIYNVITFILNEQSSYITGANIDVSGGYNCCFVNNV